MDELRTLEVKSFEVADGGIFDDVIIKGMGKIKGDIKARVIENNGVGAIFGEVESENLMISGSLNIDKDVTLEESFNLKGIANIGRGMSCENLIVEGHLVIKDSLKFSNAKIDGILKMKSGVTGDEFELTGQIELLGDLRVNLVKIDFMEKSSVSGILADKVEIKTKQEVKKSLLNKFKSKTIFKCDEIRAKDIYIENVECKILVADNVIIGENCKIDRVEYIDRFEFAKSSEVKETICRK